MTWCVLDLETQNHEYYGSLASPHHPQNYIVAAAFDYDDAEVQSWYFNSAEEDASSDWRYDTTAFTAACEMGKNMMDKVHVN